MAVTEKRTTPRLSESFFSWPRPAHKFCLALCAILALRTVQSQHRKRVHRSSQNLGLHHAPYCQTDSNTAFCLKVILGYASRLAQKVRLQDSWRRPHLPHYRARRRPQLFSLPWFLKAHGPLSLRLSFSSSTSKVFNRSFS